MSLTLKKGHHITRSQHIPPTYITSPDLSIFESILCFEYFVAGTPGLSIQLLGSNFPVLKIPLEGLVINTHKSIRNKKATLSTEITSNSCKQTSKHVMFPKSDTVPKQVIRPNLSSVDPEDHDNLLVLETEKG